MKLGFGLSLSNQRASGTKFLLDDLSDVAVAYSLRHVSGSYTGDVVLVRRSSDDAELGFTPTEITDGTLTTWTGAGDGYVKTWYDQSGNGANWTQTTTGNQPQIVSSGTVITKGGKPAVYFSAAREDNFTATAYTPGIGDTISVFDVLEISSSDSAGIIHKSDGTLNRWFGIYQNGSVDTQISNSFTYSSIRKNGSDISGSYLDRGDGYTLFATDSTNLLHFEGAVATNAWTSWDIFGSFGFGNEAYLQESIAFSASQAANRAAIETAINSYYSIY